MSHVRCTTSLSSLSQLEQNREAAARRAGVKPAALYYSCAAPCQPNGFGLLAAESGDVGFLRASNNQEKNYKKKMPKPESVPAPGELRAANPQQGIRSNAACLMRGKPSLRLICALRAGRLRREALCEEIEDEKQAKCPTHLVDD